jgi:F-type H+-transporting ATPase subunit b
VLRAVVTNGPNGLEVFLAAEDESSGESEYTPADCEFAPDNPEEFTGLGDCGAGPSPILPEIKELAWGSGTFIVFALLMRFFLYPRLRRSMDARYEAIRAGHTEADAMRQAARSEVAAYESALAEVKAEAAARVDAARAQLEQERGAQLAEANERISARRDAAVAEAAAAHEAARAEIGSAVASVASRTVELATGKAPDAATVSRVVEDSMSAGVSR